MHLWTEKNFNAERLTSWECIPPVISAEQYSSGRYVHGWHRQLRLLVPFLSAFCESVCANLSYIASLSELTNSNIHIWKLCQLNSCLL